MLVAARFAVPNAAVLFLRILIKGEGDCLMHFNSSNSGRIL